MQDSKWNFAFLDGHAKALPIDKAAWRHPPFPDYGIYDIHYPRYMGKTNTVLANGRRE